MIRSLIIAGATAFYPVLATAAVVSVEFPIVFKDETDLVTVGSGTATFNEDLLTGIGFEDIGPTDQIAMFGDDSLRLEVTIDGVIFSEANDVDFDEFPIFEFFDGVLDFIDYEAINGINGVDIDQVPEGVGFLFVSSFFDEQINPSGDNLVLVADLIAPIPTPFAGILLASALGMGAMLRRRKQGIRGERPSTKTGA